MDGLLNGPTGHKCRGPRGEGGPMPEAGGGTFYISPHKGPLTIVSLFFSSLRMSVPTNIQGVMHIERKLRYCPC